MKNLTIFAFIILAACNDETAQLAAEPVALTEDVLGHYCQMNIIEHDGPKGQIHLEGYSVPIFFGQVRDAIAYLHEPEKTERIMAAYVSDMSNAQSWASPGADNWVALSDAFFVVGSSAIGGMGAPEIVPFSRMQDAMNYAATNGGDVMQFDDIPSNEVLGAIERELPVNHKEHGQ